MIHRTEKICPRCDAPNIVDWADLSDEEKDMARRLGRAPHGQNDGKRKICTRCWYRYGEAATIA